MKIVKSSVELVNPIDYKTMLNTVELAIRNCYNSFDKMNDNSAEGIIRGCIGRRHESVLEFGDICVKIVCDRSCSHQLVRNRLCNFTQMSQRYVNWAKRGEDIPFIVPANMDNANYESWRALCLMAETTYFGMVEKGLKAEVARSILPNCTATEIYMKANIREWRHIFELRCDSHAQQDIRELMKDLLIKVYHSYPVFFEDIVERFGIKNENN